MLDDAIAAWRLCDHSQGVKGHYRNGLSCKLDGSEDHMISREALSCWRELGMPELRRAALAEVDAQIAAGGLTGFADWPKLVQHPKDAGVLHDEGAELEGDLSEGEVPWLDEAAAAEMDAEEAADAAILAEEQSVSEPPAVVDALPGDAPEDVQEALEVTKRLNTLKRLRGELQASACPAAYFQVDREIVQLERGLKGRRCDDKAKAANLVLRRSLEKAAADQVAALKAKQAEAFKSRRLGFELKRKAVLDKKKKEEEAAKKADLDAKIKALPVHYDIKSVGDLSEKGVKARQQLLERMRLRSPELPLAEQVRWPKVRDHFARHVAKVYSKGCGDYFIDAANDVLKRLECHYSGPTPFNKGKVAGGDPAAFIDFFRLMEGTMKKPAKSVAV